MFATPCINSSNPRKEVFDGQREAGCRDARLHSTYVRTHSDFALGICHQRLRSTNTGSSQVAGRTGTRRSSPRCSTGVSLIHHPHPVLVARRVADHAPDAVAVGLRLGESLDNTTMPQLSSRRIRGRRRRRRSCTTPPAAASRRYRASPTAAGRRSRALRPRARGPSRHAAGRMPPSASPPGTTSRRYPPPSPALRDLARKRAPRPGPRGGAPTAAGDRCFRRNSSTV